METHVQGGINNKQGTFKGALLVGSWLLAHGAMSQQLTAKSKIGFWFMEWWS